MLRSGRRNFLPASFLARSACFLAFHAIIRAVSHSAYAQSSISLSPKFEKSRSVYIEQQTRTIRSMQRDASGPVQTVKSESAYGMIATVLDTDGKGAARVRFTIDRVQLVDEDPAKTPIDSDAGLGESPTGVAAVAKAMLGKSVEMHMSPDRCEPAADQIAALQSAMSKAINADPRLMFLLDEFSIERFRYSWGDARLALYPNQSVKAGDTWDRALRQTMPDGNETLYNYKCKLGSIETREGRNVATLTFSGDIRQNEDTTSQTSADRDVKMTLRSGTFSGSALFDIERGEMSSQDTSAKLEVVVKAKDAKGQPLEMLLRQVIESKTTIRPVEERRRK